VVVELDGVTQQNAAMVEQATAAARSLASEAETLALQVGRFKAAHAAEARDDHVSPVRRLQERVATTMAPRSTARRPVTNGALAVAVQEPDDWSEF
jgi:methyl-accepting chemotaxis protein